MYPISILIVNNTPNQIGSNPSLSTIGTKTGVQIIMIPAGSTKHPNINKMNCIIPIITHLFRSNWTKISVSICDAPTAKYREVKTLAPRTIHIIITVKRKVDIVASCIAFHLNLLLTIITSTAPAAPIPAASVGVQTPVYITPKTNRIRKAGANIAVRLLSL